MCKCKLKFLVFGVLLASGSVIQNAYAIGQGQSGEYELNPFVVTSQRVQTQVLETPSATTTLTEKELKETGAQTLFDAISFATGITNFSYAPGGVDYGAMDSRINIRGLERGALVLVNGVPINLNGKNSITGIPMDAVQKVEVVRGSASALYGSEATGGVINIITKSPTNKAEGKAAVSFGNLGYKKYEVMFNQDKFLLSVNKTWADGVDRSSPDRVDRQYYNSRGPGNTLAIMMGAKLNKAWSATYMRTETDSLYSQISYMKDGEKRATNSKDYHYDDVRNSFALAYDKNNVKGSIFYNDRLLYGETRNYKTMTYRENDSNFKARKFGTDWQKVWDLRNGKDTFTAGVFLSRDTYQGDAATSRDKYTGRNSYALYGSYNYQISDKWETTLGARYQYIQDSLFKNQNVFTPQWQTLYKINDKETVYSNIGKAFTMPALSDAYSNGGKTLDPQQGWNYEVGYKKLYTKGALRVSLYHMDYDNIFVWTKNEQGKSIRTNGGAFKNTGLEVEYKGSINDAWNYSLGGSLSNPQLQSDGETWSQAYPKVQLTGQVAYHKNKWTAGTALNVLAKRLKNRDGGYNPNLINWNIYAAYQVTKEDQVRLEINNVLNRQNVISNGDYEYWDTPRNYNIRYEHRF